MGLKRGPIKRQIVTRVLDVRTMYDERPHAAAVRILSREFALVKVFSVYRA